MKYLFTDPKHFCVASCPLGFIDDPDNVGRCKIDKELVVEYDFNIPMTTFANKSVIGITKAATTTLDGVSGHPARSRGVYFNGTNKGFIKIDGGVQKSHTFAIHAWVMPKDLTNEIVIFSTDRNVNTTADDLTKNRQFVLSIDTDGLMKVYLAKDIDTRNQVTAKQTATVLAVDVWKYTVASVELDVSSGDTAKQLINTNVNFFIDNTKVGTTVEMTNVANVDVSGYESFVGIQRINNTGATDSYSGMFNGFIQSLMIYQKAHADTNTDHTTATRCSGAACWTADFD
jgi:hypothetical protein